MVMESYRHEVIRLTQTLDLEDLVLLRQMFHGIAHAEHPGALSSYYEGLLAHAQLSRFNYCPACGVDHDQELREHLAGLETEHASITPETLKIYSLDDLRDEDTGALLGYVCTKCGYRYPSVEDRMKRDPDDCPGCIQKTKWG